jgi:hypothetical protein
MMMELPIDHTPMMMIAGIAHRVSLSQVRSVDAEPGQEVVDQSELRVKNPSPKQNDRYAGRDIGDIEAGSKKSDPFQLLIEQKRNQKG